MSVYRRHKKTNYTCIDNHIFKDHSLSMKAKGLLAQIFSLPDNWEYSVRGLTTLFSDGREAVNNALQELIDHGYIVRTQKINQFGKFDGYEYDIYEVPQISVADNPFTENPITENPITENPITENPNQLNTNNENTNEEITEENNIDIFIRPDQVEILDYFKEFISSRGLTLDPYTEAERFDSYYTERNWYTGDHKMQSWKASAANWILNSNSYQRKNSNFNE